MSDDPVVETINAILNGEDNFILLLQRPQLERIRDEIVALGNDRAANERMWLMGCAAACTEARAEALEEAARVCDALYDGYGTATTDQTDPEQVWLDACDRAATRIRALKEKGHE